MDEIKMGILQEIEEYKKNNKALCDMLAFYTYCLEDGKRNSLAIYVVLEELIKDLEDPEVTISLKAPNIESLFSEDTKRNYEIYDVLKDTEYFQELAPTMREDYRTRETKKYLVNLANDKKIALRENSFNFFYTLCDYSLDFVSEFLSSNIPMERKTDILYECIVYCIENGYPEMLNNLLSYMGTGMDLSRTPLAEKDRKIQELTAAFRTKMAENPEAKINLVNVIRKNYQIHGVKDRWLTLLQNKMLVDFTDIRDTVLINAKKEEVSICATLNLDSLNNFKHFYQLNAYKELPENIRRNDDLVILSALNENELAEFISLSSYQTSLEDIDIIAKRVLNKQIADGCPNEEIIADIKNAIIHKAKNKEEYKTYCELAAIFATKADYEAYIKKVRKEIALKTRKRIEEKNKLIEARHELYKHLYNLNESLQEQVPSRKVIKTLNFKKN